MLEQIFFYITKKCNIRCITCYALEPLSKAKDLGYDSQIKILQYFSNQGATKLSLLGGEPTLHQRLPDIIVEAKNIGYNFVRINTNGLFNKELLLNEKFKNVDLICFSIDGATNQINNKIRKNGSLKNTLINMRYAKINGYEIRVNVTITSFNINNVFEIIKLAEDEGASLIYFNVVMLMGEALHNKELVVLPNKWIEVYNKVLGRHNDFSIKIKIPPSFSNYENLQLHKQNGHKCIIEDKSRVYVSSNGNVFNSIVYMDNSKYRIGCFENDNYFEHKNGCSNNSLYCEHLKSNSSAYFPLCIHYKTKLNY